MEFVVVPILTVMALFSIYNFVTLRSLRVTNPTITESVAILIPMRNEERNVTAVLSSVLGQNSLSDLEIRVLDDSSNDRTSELLFQQRDPRMTITTGSALPAGWLGKNFALHNLSQDCDQEFLVFLDADVRLEPSAIASAIAEMKARNWDYISPYPRQLAPFFLAKLVQPLLQWSWFATLPLRLIENSQSTATVVANGQFLIVRNETYRRAGGHESIKAEVLDDLELARSMRRVGGSGSVVDASAVASCEMYRSSRELIDGYSKSQWRAFGGLIGAFLAILILFLTSIYPFMALINDEPWALPASLVILVSRILVALRTRSVLWSALLHPAAIAFWIFLIIRSYILKKSGKLSWRARAI